MNLKAIWILVFLLQFSGVALSQHSIQSLSGQWRFSENGTDAYFPAQVPGNIFTDLERNNLIPDPFYGTNEALVKWVSLKNWKYSLNFAPDQKLLTNKQIFLCFESLDTRADIIFNGDCIAQSNNMFLPLKLDVTNLIRKDTNTVEIIFYSPVILSDSLWENYPVRLPDHPRVMLRKAAYHFGWDWGPQLTGCGVRKPVYLEGILTAVIDNIHLVTRSVRNDTASIDCHISIYATHPVKINLELNLNETSSSPVKFNFETEKGLHTFTVNFQIPDAKLWWPNGWGGQHLYRIQCQISDTLGNVLDKQTETFGIREILLVQNSDTSGSSFYFQVNGKPIFIKGANYIPADFFAERTTFEKYEMLISGAAQSNMNMLRVWGGGVYEDDVFYDLCDQYGILVWQDFMFACAMYPFDSTFVESVQSEVKEHIIRLRNHPSIALWCGNNESDEGWHNWGWQKSFGLNRNDSAAIYQGYLHVFDNIIPSLVAEYDGTRPYHPSSPSTGWGRTEAYESGDVHYWGVWWGMRPFETYKSHTGRFVSEYGFQALPNQPTLLQTGVSADSGIHDAVLKSHQKHPSGFETISHYMHMYAHVPEKLTDYIYLSQYIQVLGLTTAIESHRRSMPFCMGTLYWQLNDCWPVVSWSGIDYYGRYKALQFHIRKLFEPFILSIVESDHNLEFWAISEKNQRETSILNIQCFSFTGQQLWSLQYPFQLNGVESMKVADIKTSEFLKHPEESYIKAVISQNNIILTEKLFFPAHFKDQKLPECDITLQCKQKDDSVYLTLTAPCLCRFVELSYNNETDLFEDNYFDLQPGHPKQIRMLNISPSDYNYNNIHIRSLQQIGK